MTPPLVSVVVPAYNNAAFLGATIKSVLDQTYPHFELLVVDDASPDDIAGVVARCDDRRLRYLVHERNKGLAAARNTGMRASAGELIALLDGDDLFHPEKLRLHVAFHAQHPEVGVTYNARFELNHSAETIRELWRPPLGVGLEDLVLGFPFGPSDMVLRRDWAFRVGLFDERYTYYGEDLDINLRLGLAGCKFASVDRALNYRRYHSRREIQNIRSYQEAEIRPLLDLFANPDCPPTVLALRDLALANRYLGWAQMAFAQDETSLGQEDCLLAVRFNPALRQGKPSRLVRSFLAYSVLDESQDHGLLLRRLFAQLPADLADARADLGWAISQGHLVKGVRAILWGRPAEGREHLARARALGVQVEEAFLRGLSAQLLDYEAELGSEAAGEALANLCRHLDGGDARRLRGLHALGRAFGRYSGGDLAEVPGDVLRAVANDPRHLRNRGAAAILFRSLAGRALGRARPARGSGTNAARV